MLVLRLPLLLALLPPPVWGAAAARVHSIPVVLSATLKRAGAALGSLLAMPRHPLPAQAGGLSGMDAAERARPAGRIVARRIVSSRSEQTRGSELTLELASSEDERGEAFVALYDYDRERGNQLSFRAGQRMTVLSRIDRDWFRARLDDGQIGEVPARLLVPTANSGGHAGARSRSRSPTRSPTRSPARTRSASPTRRPRSVSPSRRPRLAHRPGSVSPSRSGRGSPLRSTVVQMHNMVDHSERIDDEDLPLLEADVKAECEASGTVRSVMIVPSHSGSENAVVYVEFEREADASRAVAFFNDADADGTKDPTTAELFSEPEFDRISSMEADRRRQSRRSDRLSERRQRRTTIDEGVPAVHRSSVAESRASRGTRRAGATTRPSALDTQVGLARWFAHEVTEDVRAALLDDGEDLTSAFHRMDKDGDGYLTASEFRRGLRSLTGKGLTAEEMDLLMDEFDANGDNEIEYTEFISAFRRSARAQQLAGEVQMDVRKRLQRNKDDLLGLLDDLDAAGDGLLTSSDVRRALRRQGLTAAEIDQLVRVFAVHDGKHIDFAGLLEVVLHEAGLPSPRRSTSRPSVRSPRSERSPDRGTSSSDRRRRSDRLTVVQIRDYIEATARLLRERDCSSLENDVEHEMEEYGAVNGVLIVLPPFSSPASRKIETYVRFATESAAKKAEQALTDSRYRAVLLEEEEYEQIEIDEGRSGNRPLGRSWSDTSLDRKSRLDREAKAKRLAQVIGKDLRDAFPKGADLRSTFRWMDQDNDGVLSHEELKAGLREFTGRQLTDEWLREVIDLFDANGDGEIQYREFCDIFDAYDRAESTTKDVLYDLRSQLRSYSNHDDTELRRVFRSFDANGDGKLSREEFQRGLRRLLQIDLDSAQMDDVMKVVDADGDGEIDLDEFLSAATPIVRKDTTTQSTRSLSGQLEVRVVKCINLLPRKGKTTATPCVKMSIGQGKNEQQWKSQYQQQTLDPVFRDGVKAIFDVHDDGATLTSNALSTLVIQVCDWQLLGGDKLLGEVDIDLRKEFGNSWTTGEQRKRHKWLLFDYDNQTKADVTRAKYPTEPYGAIELDIKFIPKQSPDGRLTVKIARCNDLIPMDRNGRSDPYVKVELLQGEKYKDVTSFRTATIPKTLNPVFTDRPTAFRVDYESYIKNGCWLRVTVFNEDKLKTDKMEGVVQLDLNDRFRGQWTSEKLELREAFALTDPDKTITVPEIRRRQAHPYGTVEVHLDFVGGDILALGMPGPEPEPEPGPAVASLQPSTAAVRTDPVCLLRRDGGSLRIDPAGKALLEELGEAPVAVVSVAGLGRTGKSFLLNQLLGRGPGDKWSKGSSSRFGVDRNGRMQQTSGIWCCLVPAEAWCYEESPATRLLLLDTESLDSSKSTSRDGIGWGNQCFALSVLLSSLLVYNSLGEIDEKAIEQLYMMRDLTQHIHVSAAVDTPRRSRKPDTGETLARYTPAFMWLLRDFEPSKSAASAFDTTELEHHLEEGLEERIPRARARTTSGSTITRMQEQNQTRAAFRQLFPTRCCRALVYPVDYTDDLSDLSALPPRSFRPDFLHQVQSLRDDIFQMVKPKQLFGQTVSARLLLTLLRSYVDDLNRRLPPDIRKAWDMSEGRVLEDVYLSAREQYETGMDELCAKTEEIFLYECIHPAGVTDTKEMGSQPQLIAQIEDGETIEVLESGSIDRGSRLGTVERLRTHCGWVSKESGNKRLFVEVAHLETREKITVKQVRDCLRNVDRLLKGEITGVRSRNANRKTAQDLCLSVFNGLDDQLTEAKTLEWSNSRVSEVSKLLRHYTKMQSYDVREADIGFMLALLKDLADVQWHAPVDELAGAAVGVLGAQAPTTVSTSSSADHEYFTTTLIRPAKGGFGINVGHDCEVLDFIPSPDGRKSVAEIAGVLPGMTIVEVNGTPVRDKKGVTAAITRGSSAKTLFKFRKAAASIRARSASPTSDRLMATRRFDEEAALRRTRLGDAHGRQQRRVLLTREQFDEGHWQLAARAIAQFQRSSAVPTVETVLQWRQKLDLEMKEIYSAKLQALERDSVAQCRSLMHELCEGLLRRVHYGSFDYPRGEPDYQRALTEMMAVYDKEASRRGGPAKDLVAREAITQELPQVFKAFMERQLDIEATKNRGLETVLGARCLFTSMRLSHPEACVH